VLLGDEACADACAEVLVQEPGHLDGVDVSSGLEEAAREDGDGVTVRLDEVGKDGGELNFVIESGDLLLVVGQEGGQRVLVVAVDLGDVGVGYDDVGEVAQGVDAVGEADREEGEGEVGGGEEILLGQGRSAVPVTSRR